MTVLTGVDEVPDELLRQAMELSEVGRTNLAKLLTASVAQPGSLSPEWKEEIARRLKAQQEGRTRYYTRDEAAARLQRVVGEGTGQ